MLNIKRREIPQLPPALNEYPEVIQRIYAGRGISSQHQLKRSAAELLPLQTMRGLDQACPILFEILQQQKLITIVGDFDADGAARL